MKTPDTTSAKFYFRQYAYHRFCNEKDADGHSLSLPILYLLAGQKPQDNTKLPRSKQVEQLLPQLPKSVASAVKTVENVAEQINAFSTDCEDEDYLRQSIIELKNVLPLFKKNDITDLKIRSRILSHVYDFYEQLYPDSREMRFKTLQQMVRDIKVNDGSFDYDPLNLAARQTDYFMRSIDPEKRYALLLEINKKTINKQRFNYTDQLHRLAEETKHFQEKKSFEQRLSRQARYEHIRETELPAAEDNQTKINLYRELLSLMNSQDFSRSRKFNEKKTIYNHLIELYQSENMQTELQQAYIERHKFANAGKIAAEAARRKGYRQGR